jgi:hypothetical protein
MTSKKRHVNMPWGRSLILNAQIKISIYSAWVSGCSSPCLKTTPKELKTKWKMKLEEDQWVP